MMLVLCVVVASALCGLCGVRGLAVLGLTLAGAFACHVVAVLGAAG
jgi:hypothetical protein